VVQLVGLLFGVAAAMLRVMDDSRPDPAVTRHGDILPPGDSEIPAATAALAATPASQSALVAAQALAKKAAALATLRAYKADWTHFADWCAAHGFVPVPAAPAVGGAYFASLAGSHAPTTIRRRLSALGKCTGSTICRQRGAWIGCVAATTPSRFGVRQGGHSSGVPSPACG